MARAATVAARRTLGALLLTALAALCLAPAPLWAKSLTYERYDVRLEVRRDGTVVVTETMRIRFEGAWNGVFRDISLRHATAEGKRRRLDVRVDAVTDGTGAPLEHETSRDGGYRRLKIWVPGAEDAMRTVVVRYTVRGAVRHFDARGDAAAFDELYWNAIPEEADGVIAVATARVVLPDGLAPTQSAAYLGAVGATERAAVAEEGGEVVATAARPLQPGEVLTLAVGWPAGVVERPGAAQGALAAALAFWPLGIPFLAFFGMLGHWRRHGRDPQRRAIVVQYEPPADLTPAEVGTLIDHAADMHDLTATLVDLAVRGYVVIEEREEKRFLGLSTSREYTFHAARPEAAWKALRPHEERFLRALFASGTRAAPLAVGAGGDAGAPAAQLHASVKLSQLTNRFYKELPAIRDAVYTQLVQRGFYLRRPDATRAMYVAGGAAVAAVAFFAAFYVDENGTLGLNPFAVGGGLGVSGLLVIAFGWFMPARTEAGARTQEAALGFREFLDRVESDRYRRTITSPELFERYLPFAMAFRVEDRWARAFESLCTTPPTWYHGGGTGGYRTTRFVGELNRMTVQANTAMRSQPSSSGSGGGGRAGGGSGGGRVGGF